MPQRQICGLEDASLHPLWPRNQGQGQTTKLSSLGSPSQPLNQASPSREHHPCSTLGLYIRLSSLRGQGCEKNHPSMCYEPLFPFLWLCFLLSPEDTRSVLLSAQTSDVPGFCSASQKKGMIIKRTDLAFHIYPR